MKRKVIALGLAFVLCLSMPLTAFAASSSTGNHSKPSKPPRYEENRPPAPPAPSAPAPSWGPAQQPWMLPSVKPGMTVAPGTVSVIAIGPDGRVVTVTLDQVITSTSQTVITSAVTPAGAVAAVQGLLTTTVSQKFTATVGALAAKKGTSMIINNCGTIRTAAMARDAFGNVIASVGVIRNVTSGSLIMLMSVNSDGSVEYVEGVVDPVTGAVMGAFQGVPSVITVLVLA